jgi:hypothetical protein
MKRAALAAAIAIAAEGCAERHYLDLADASAPVMIGTGRYHYQLVFTDNDGEPQANKDFALSLPHGRLPFIPDEKNVWRGKTDSQGQTPVFALPFRLTNENVLLRGRIGDGPYGEQMWLGYDQKHPLPGHPYRLLLCTDPPQQFFGVTDAQGYTVYAASDHAVPVGIYADTDALSDKDKDRRAENLAYCRGEAVEATAGKGDTERSRQVTDHAPLARAPRIIPNPR